MKRIWERLSKREKGLVALSIFIFIVVLARFLIVAPFLARREWVESQLEIQPELLGKNLRYVSQKGEMAASLEKARADLKATDSLLLPGNTPSVSASELQQIIQGLAGKVETQVISTRVLNPDPLGPFTKIPVQVEVSGQIDQVANLIKGIESAEKLLVITELNIRSLFVPVARPQGVPQTTMQNLRASLTVTGFARTSTLSSSKKEAAPAAKAGQAAPPAKGLPRR